VKIFESIPNAQLFIVPKTSHYVLSENAKVFNEAALRFFRKG
jgi:pimeloyl-ACP methyl ester carboxylesterase